MYGSTNTDRTNYFETVPSNQLEKMLWLEADRMGFLLDSVTQLKFEVQRATVKNERGQRYDNAPYGVVGEKRTEDRQLFKDSMKQCGMPVLKSNTVTNFIDAKRRIIPICRNSRLKLRFKTSTRRD